MAEEKIVHTPCQDWGCHECCPLETHMEDGVIKRCQKVTLPDFQVLSLNMMKCANK